MPGKRVEFRPTVLVCDGSPERLHDSTPRPRQRSAPGRQPPAPPPPPPPPPVGPPPVPGPGPGPGQGQGPEPVCPGVVCPGPPCPAPKGTGSAGQGPKRLGPCPTPKCPPPVCPAPVCPRPACPAPVCPGPACPPAVVRGRADGADARRTQTLPSAGGRAPPVAGRGDPWRPAGSGTLPVRPRPRSVPGGSHRPAESPQCFQCAGAQCLAASGGGRADPVSWPGRWRPAASTARRPASVPDSDQMAARHYQYSELGGDGGQRRTWVKPGRALSASLEVNAAGDRPAAAAEPAEPSSAASLLNRQPAPDGQPALRRAGWLCRSQVIAFICGLIVLLLMALALASSDWLLSDGWRQGLFAHCTEEDAGRPLPFDLPFEPGCHRARDVAYIVVSEALAICCMLLDAFATLMAGLGLWSKDTNKKYRYYRAAVYVMIIALVSILIALVVYPVCFAQELEESYHLVGRDPGNRTVWEFGWAYGVGWGAAIFLFGGVILLLCDKESEEIYYKERTIMHDERA